MARAKSALRFKLLAILALTIVVGWSILWFMAAAYVDRQVNRTLHMASGQGTAADCAGQGVTGFPFRIELRCGPGSHAVTGRAHAEVGGLTVAALIYDPDQLLAEVRGPATVRAAGVPQITADWSLAHASARLNLSDGAVERFDAEVQAADLTVGGAAMTLNEVDLNTRIDPEDPAALNVAVRVERLEAAFLSAPLSVTMQGTVANGAALLAGQPEAFLAALATGEVPIAIDTLRLDHGDMALAATGTLLLDRYGLLHGELDVALAGDEMAARTIEAALPGQGDALGALLKNLLKNAPNDKTIGGKPAKALSLKLTDGRVTVGRFPFPLPFQIPPVAIATP